MMKIIFVPTYVVTLSTVHGTEVNRVYSSDKTCLSYNNWRPVQGNKSWAYTRISKEMEGALSCSELITQQLGLQEKWSCR